MRHLRVGGLVALAVRMGADLDLDVAVGGEPHVRLLVARDHRPAPGGEHRGAVRALLDEEGEADADQPAVGLGLALARAHLGQPDRRDRAAQAFGMVAAVEMLLDHVVERHLLRPHHVAQAELVGLELRLARERIHDDLDGEADAGAGDAAIRQDRALVGGDRGGAAAVGVEDVRPGQQVGDLRGLEPGGDRIDRVGAGIDRADAVDRQQLAVARRVAGDGVVVLAAVGVGGEMLAHVLDPAHRMIELHREPRQRDLLAGEHALVAEAAADVGRDHADVAVLEAEAFGEAGLHRMRELRRRDQREETQARIAIGEHAAAFDRQHAVAGGADLARHLEGGARGGLLDVAVLGEFDEDVVLPVLVDQRRAGLLRGDHVGDGRQLVVFDADAARDVLGLGAGRRHAHGDELADEAQLAGRQDRLGRRLEAADGRRGRDRLDAGQVVGGEHRRRGTRPAR